MDPSAAWERICRLGADIIVKCDAPSGPDHTADADNIVLVASELADTIAGLKQWIGRGGFCPHCSKGASHESK